MPLPLLTLSRLYHLMGAFALAYALCVVAACLRCLWKFSRIKRSAYLRFGGRDDDDDDDDSDEEGRGSKVEQETTGRSRSGAPPAPTLLPPRESPPSSTPPPPKPAPPPPSAPSHAFPAPVSPLSPRLRPPPVSTGSSPSAPAASDRSWAPSPVPPGYPVDLRHLHPYDVDDDDEEEKEEEEEEEDPPSATYWRDEGEAFRRYRADGAPDWIASRAAEQSR